MFILIEFDNFSDTKLHFFQHTSLLLIINLIKRNLFLALFDENNRHPEGSAGLGGNSEGRLGEPQHASSQ